MNYRFIIRVGIMMVLALAPLSMRAAASPADVSQSAAGNTITVKGVVTDDKGEPLPGASVMVKGTTVGTITDLDGKYSIAAKSNATLVVSFIGFKDQEVAIAGKTQVNVALAGDSTVLDDVVVVGYGSIKKANLTGAVDQVKADRLENKATANLDQLLTGVTTNMDIQVTDGAPYRTAYGYALRGNSVIGNPNIPTESNTLVLVDGVEYNGLDGDLSLINPNDIESISVLKDAAASSIYGGRAAYGVVLITTKNPVKQDHVSVSYSSNFSMMTPTALPDLVTDGEAYSKFIAQGYYNYQGKYATVSNLEPAKIDPSVLAAGYAENNGKTIVSSKGAYTYYGNTDWYDYIYKDHASSQVHNLSVNGSSGKVNYLISGRYYDYSGLYVGDADQYNTFNIRSKINSQVTKWLKISENIDYTYDNIYMATATKGDGLSTPEAQLYTYGAPTWEVYNPDGSFTKAGSAILSGLYGDLMGNDVSKYNTKKKLTKSFRTTTGFEASFFKNTLRVKGDYTFRDKGMRVTQEHVSPFYSETEGNVTTLLAAKNLYKQAVREKNRETQTQLANLIAEYENTFGRHYMKVMAGGNYEKRDYREVSIRKRGLELANAGAGNLYNFALGEPSADSSGNLGDPTYVGTGKPDEFANRLTVRRLAGVFGRINYSYADRYLLEINARYDGSSYFSLGNQWGFFPSASLGWRVSQEPWWHVNPMIISSLKFRTSYGELGDGNSSGPYAYETLFGIKQNKDKVINGSSTTNTLEYPDEINSQFTWSTLKTFNVGADMSFLGNRVDLSADYYIRRNINMLADGLSHPSVYGTEAAKGNYADMSNYGWEVSLSYNDSWMVAGKPFHFGARGAISNNWSIIDRYEGNPEGAYGNGIFREGMRLGEIWGFQSNGIFQTQDQIDNAMNYVDETGKSVVRPYVNTKYATNKDKKTYVGDVWIKDLDNSGAIDAGAQTVDDSGDQTIIGNAYARCPYTFGFNAEWNGIYASIDFNGVMHQDWAPGGKHLFWNQFTNSNGPLTKWLTENVWTEDNPDALLPRISTGNALIKGHDNPYSKYINNTPIDRFLFNIGYLNIKNVQIGYSLPKKLISKAGFSAIKVFVQAENLYNWSPIYKQIGRDFDVMSIAYGGDDYNDGMEWWSSDGGFQYPRMRTFSLGLNITLGNSTASKAANYAANAELAAALAAANAAAEAAKANAGKLQDEIDALKSALDKAVKEKDDCLAAGKTMAQKRAEAFHVEDIYFALNQSVIRDSEAGKVEELIKVLKANPDATIEIYGYADQATGTAQRNLMLTKERALVVADALKAAGIAASRISTEFYGTEKDSSFTPENNRLAVCIVNK
ncbi:MAG: SusC/RagA family TonB-linked outer membrane protein [Bacteroidales bacterium]|nr:SusC/RagA family TonB-linked outer membrane protein [Bacteroidales bacterium]